MNKPSYIKELDGLRALAILLVIVWHYLLGQTTQEMLPNYLWQGLSWSWSGVDLFFVLSGFLIGRILIYYKDSSNYFSTFYWRRAFRIFPVFYLLLGIYLLLKFIGLTAQFPVLLDNPLPDYPYFFYIQNFFMSESFGTNWMAVTWSLAIEEQFYLLFPLLIYYLPNKHLPKAFLIGVILAPFFRYILGGNNAYVLLPARMDALLMGALVAYYFQNGIIDKWVKPNRKYFKWLTLLAFGVVIFLVFSDNENKTGEVLNHSVYAVFYSLVIVTTVVSQSEGLWSKILVNPTLRFIGKISYSVYLTHQIFILLLSKLILNKDVPWLENSDDIWVTILSFVCTIAFSTLLYFILEKPMQKIGRRYSY